MERRIDEELESLKSELLNMAARVETNIRDAFEGLLTRNPVLLEDVRRRDPEIDLREIQIDERCISLIALHQPVARDLRFIATTLKIVKDIERIGDTASNLAQHGLQVIDHEEINIPRDLSTISTAARRMLKEALDAFVKGDVFAARQVIQSDDLVDELHKKIVNELVQNMAGAAAERIHVLTHVMSVAKFIERIGDHSSNIAEMVVFLVEGKDIRHHEKLRHLLDETS